MLTGLHATRKVNTTLSGTGSGANLLPASAPATGAGVVWNSGTGTATATAAADIVAWLGSVLVPGQGYSVTLNYTMSAGSKLRVRNGLTNGVSTPVASAVLGASGTITLFFVALDQNFAIEADTAVFTGTISAINLQSAPALVATSTGAGGVRTNRPITGLTYFEGVITTLAGTPQIGIAANGWDNSTALGNGTNTVGYQPSGAVRNNNATLATIATYVQGDRIGVAIDPLNRFIWFRVNNGNWNNNAANDPVTGVGGIDYGSIAGLDTMVAAISASITGTVWTMKFSTAFTDTPPTGFASLDVVGYTSATTQQPTAGNMAYGGTPASYGFRASFAKDGVAVRPFNGSTITRVGGTIYELSVPVAGRRIDVYDRATGELLGTTVSAGDGSWSIPCLGRPTVRVVASDPTAYNSLAYDNVSPA